MSYTFEQYKEAADQIRAMTGGFAPEILLILGSGLGNLGNEVEDPVYVPYKEVPHMKTSSAPGHIGRFVFGTLGGRKVCVMQGRIHCYEGYTMEDTAFPVRLFKLLGGTAVILTNAAGCINKSWNAGDLCLITDHIRLFGFGPLNGPNVEEFGTRFNDMTSVYTPDLQGLARKVAKEQNIVLREGVYMYFPGPQFETPAEIRAAGILGADLAGMSTVPEATVARHCGLDILGISLCTNMAAGILSQPLSGEEVNACAEQAAPRFRALILGILEQIAR